MKLSNYKILLLVMTVPIAMCLSLCYFELTDHCCVERMANELANDPSARRDGPKKSYYIKGDNIVTPLNSKRLK